MSVINQVLLDLENRRAFSGEDGTVHPLIRAVAKGRGHSRTRPSVAFGVALLIVIAIYAAMGVFDGRKSEPLERDAVGPQLASASVKPISAINEVAQHPAAAERERLPASEMQLAARLSFELSRLPEVSPDADVPTVDEKAIASARVLGKAPAEARGFAAATTAAETKKSQPRSAEPRVAPKAPTQAGATIADALPAESSAGIDKRMRQPTAQQLAEAEFRKATLLLHQGRFEEARAGFQAALGRYGGHHRARQALLGVLVETRRNAEAEQIMVEGLELSPDQIGFAMALARLQMDRGDVATAIATLQRFAGHAQAQGEYLAFLGGLLQREHRNAEAIQQFEAALQVKPDHGLWLLGLGISLQAVGRDAEAQNYFRRARVAKNINPELAALAELRLNQLQ